jgi:hypothetical protein
MSPTSEAESFDAIRTFWRERGYTLPLLIKHRMLLDVAELLRQVGRRGGFWCVCAAQV